jgi:hypothetical protein
MQHQGERKGREWEKDKGREGEKEREREEDVRIKKGGGGKETS